MTHISYTQADQQFLADVNAYIERYISKQVITLAMIADSLQMSHAAIRHKIWLLTGLSGSDYILKVRLQHSLHQMIHEHRNVSEAATENGFKDLSYFRNCFKDEYGMTPMEYLDRLPARDITNLKKTIKTMKQRLIAMLLSLPLAVVVLAQPATAQADFVKGADVGFLQGQERRGVKFHDRNGKERECLELLKNDYQLSAIRMRVWVNPRGGDCDKFALLAMAKRVKALGMELMVDFHYSDSWADPAKQPIPKAWLGHSFEEMKQDVRNHTIEVLSLLKANGIQPRWVQVGNETTNGMLWSVKTNERGWEVKDSLGNTIITHSMGHIKTEPRQYAGFIRAGYDAVKEVFPDAIVIVHLDRGHRQSLYDYNLDTILKYGGKFDMVGMSLYPYWAMEGHPELNADDIISDCIKNIRHVSEKYKCDVMIVETGYEVDEQHPEKMEEGRRQLARVVRESRNETGGHCRGVFYWEPQCLPGGYKLGAFDGKATPTAIMDGFIEKND